MRGTGRGAITNYKSINYILIHLLEAKTIKNLKNRAKKFFEGREFGILLNFYLLYGEISIT